MKGFPLFESSLPIFILAVFVVSCENILTPGGDGDDGKFALKHDFQGGPKLIESQPILLTWSQITFTRFERYTVERSVLQDGKEVWSERTTITDPQVISWTDTLDDDGVFRYRVRMIGAGQDTIEAVTGQITLRTTSITVPDEIECLQDAYDSPFIDDGDSLLVNPPTPCTVANPLTFVGKDILITGVAGKEETVIERSGTILTMNKGTLRGFTFVRGGVHLSGTAVMEDCDVKNGGSQFSGVVAEDSATVYRTIISNRVIWPVTGTVADGAGMTVKDRATVLQSRITGNTAFNRGGGLAIYGQPTIKNCIVDGNEAAYGGGGIYLDIEARPRIVNCVLYKNRSGLPNGQLGSILAKRAGMIFINNIVWANTSYGQEDRLWQSASYSNIQGYHQGTGNISSPPGFVDAVSGDFHLLSSSPSIDTGHPGSEYEDPDGSRNDMGAYGGPWGDW